MGDLCRTGSGMQGKDVLEFTVMVDVHESDRTMGFNMYSSDTPFFTPRQVAIAALFCDCCPSVTTKSVSGA